MSKPRAATLLLAIVAAGVWMGTWEAGEAVLEGVQAEKPVEMTAKADVPAGVPATRVVHFWTGDETAAQSTEARPAVALGADEGAMVAEVAALQTLARDADLELSPRQWSAFAAATAHVQAVRQAYEATLATATKPEPGRYRLEIPAYPAAGDALRAQLAAELRAQLGETTAAEIVAQLGGALEGHFGGFGVSVQTLEFSTAAGQADSDYQVTRTVKFWNATNGADRLTTRRETLFPGLEDPSGHAWGPFLATLAAAGGPTRVRG